MADRTRLLVRVDDAGSSWASNMGCLRACTDGIARSVEVMMPGAWVRHAAALFNDRPEIDIGIHLTLIAEWEAVTWRPLTHAPSLVGEDGAFLPLLMPRSGDDRPCLLHRPWSLDEVAAELRAQVELGCAMFAGVSHVSSHMVAHLAQVDPRLGPVVADLCAEFGLRDDPLGDGMHRIAGYPKYPLDPGARVAAFIEALQGLGPGPSIFVDHPAVASAELDAMGHPGYGDVAPDRVACLETLTSPELRAAIDRMGIELIAYREL